MAETYGMDGTRKSTKGDKKPKNFLLDAVRKRLLRKDNVAPASKFTKKQKGLQDAINRLVNEEY